MENLLLSSLFILFGIICTVQACKYWFTDEEYLYSDYRNRIDLGRRLFKKMLFRRRWGFSLAAVVLFGAAIYMLS